jgi:hypothetical protein
MPKANQSMGRQCTAPLRVGPHGHSGSALGQDETSTKRVVAVSLIGVMGLTIWDDAAVVDLMN